VNIVILSRVADVYANRRLLQAAHARGHSARVCDFLQAPNAMREGLLPGRDCVLPRYGPRWQVQGQAALMGYAQAGIASCNRIDAMALARSKQDSALEFQRIGLPMPSTVFFSQRISHQAFMSLNLAWPQVLKRNDSAQGDGVSLHLSPDSAWQRMQPLFNAGVSFALQAFIAESAGTDLRVFIIGGNAVAAMQRTAREGEFRANRHLGAKVSAIALSPIQEGMAIRAAACLGLEIAGVDILMSRHGPLLLEVNACPGFEALEATTGVDVAGKILELLETRQN